MHRRSVRPGAASNRLLSHSAPMSGQERLSARAHRAPARARTVTPPTVTQPLPDAPAFSSRRSTSAMAVALVATGRSSWSVKCSATTPDGWGPDVPALSGGTSQLGRVWHNPASQPRGAVGCAYPAGARPYGRGAHVQARERLTPAEDRDVRVLRRLAPRGGAVPARASLVSETRERDRRAIIPRLRCACYAIT